MSSARKDNGKTTGSSKGRPSRRVRVAEEVWAAAAERYQAGEHGTVLARELGVTDSTVTRNLRRLGVVIRKRGQHRRVLTDTQEVEIAERYEAGATTPALAESYGVSETAILGALDRQGVPRRGTVEAQGHRFALPHDQEVQLAQDYLDGDGQVILGRRYRVSVIAVRAALRRQKVTQRSPGEVNAVRLPVEKAIDLYEIESKTTWEIAEQLGFSQSVVLKHLRRAGVEINNTTRKYRVNMDHHWWDVVDLTRAYWAGFLAADGSVVGNTVKVGLARKDRCLLEVFKQATGVDQPVVDYVNNHRKLCSGFYVTSPKWCGTLSALYNIVPCKAKILKPPSLDNGGPLTWAFVRGYFDGDGHADAQARSVQFTSGSRPFIEWVKLLARAHHSVYLNNGSWGMRITGPVGRATAKRMYADSTPETRLERKYLRLKRVIDGEWVDGRIREAEKG